MGIETASTAATKNKPATPTSGDTAALKPAGDKPVAPPSDAATTAGKLQGSVEMLNAPPDVTNLPAGKVNELAKEANKGINSDIKVEPNPNSPINKPLGDQKPATVTLSSDVEAKRLEAQNRAKTTAALGDNPNNPPAAAAKRTDVPPTSTEAKLQSAADQAAAKRAGLDQPPPAASTEAQLQTIADTAAAKRAGTGNPPPAGSTEAQLQTIADTAAAKRAGTGNPPPAGSTEAQLQTIADTAAAKRAGTGNPPPAGSTEAQLQTIADTAAAKRAGTGNPPPAGSTEAQLQTIADTAAAKRAGTGNPPPAGSTEAKLQTIGDTAAAKRAGTGNPPPAGSTEAKLQTIGDTAAAKRAGTGNPPGATEAHLQTIADTAAAKRAGTGNPPGATEAQLQTIADTAAAKRAGTGNPPGATEAKLQTIADTAAGKRAEIASNNPPANPLRDTRGDGTPKPGKSADPPVLDTSGKPRPATEVVKPADTTRRSVTETAPPPLTPAEKREARVQARADNAAERAAKRDAPPVVKPDTPAVTPAQTRAEVIAAKKAERQAASGDPPPATDTTRGRQPKVADPSVNPPADTTRGRPKAADPPVTPPADTTKGRTRADAPAPPTGDPVVKPVRPERPVTPAADTGDTGAKRPRQPAVDTPGDTTALRPNRRGPDTVGDTTGAKPPGKPDRALGPTEPGDGPKGKPVLPPTGDGPVVARRGDRADVPGVPGGDPLARGRKVDTPNAPLDPRQQRFLAEIAKGNDPKSQVFKENFEKLSPQNRNALMNMDGKQQQEMIAKLSKPIERGAADIGKVEAGKLPVAGDLAKLTARQDLKIPGLDVADPANRKFLTDVTTRLHEVKLDGTNANMKVSDLLKGLDPQKVSALEKFLSANTNMDAGKLTLGQVDGARLTQFMKSNFDLAFATGKQLTPQDALHSLTRQFTAGDGTNTLSVLGRTLNDMGTPPGRLSELVAKSLDAKSPLSVTNFDLGLMPGRMGDFTARLNPLQELNIRSMLENSSKLGLQLDSRMARFDFSGRGDMTGTAIGLSQILATTFGDRGGDFAVRGELVRPHGQAMAAAAEAAEAAGGRSQEYIAKLPIDATTGLPYDPSTGKLLDPMTGRPIGDRVSEEKKSQKQRDDEEEMDEKEKKKQKKDADQEAEKAKQKAMLFILQAKKKREQELREKQLKDEKQKKEDETRVKYICKDGDTVQSVALKQLRDGRVAPLIYQINKQVIPTKIVNGESVPLLHAGLVIWLPSPKEIREFRSKLVGGGVAKAPSEKFASAEDELAARFGAGWAAGKSQDNGGQQQPDAQPMSDLERKLMEDAMAEAKRRRENIEKALGPITGSTTRGARLDGEHLSYQVRLGDTLRSVATKHPSIGDVNLWRLLAEVNDLSTEVDSKGQPKAGLARGGKIKIPTAAEITEYRQRVGSMAGQPITREQRVAKNCPKCGRMTVQSASLCPCGHEFNVDREPVASNKDAGTIVLEAITETPEGSRGSRTEDLDYDPTPTTKVGQPTNDAAQPVESRESQERTVETAYDAGQPQVWAACKDFEPTCRLTKSALAWDAADGKLIIHLQLRNDEHSEWFPILEYEVYASYSIRHTFVRQTRAKKTVKIDLPAAAAMELAQNDLLANWNNYKTKYLLA